MGANGDDVASRAADSGMGKEQNRFRRNTNMRTGLKYLTSALVAGAAAAAIAVAPIAVAPIATADPAPARQTMVASTPSTVDAGHVVETGFRGGGGLHGGGFHGGGLHGGWGGYRGGWYGGPGWGRSWSPWGWYR